MAKHGEITYQKESDIFFIHKGFKPDEKFQGNIEIGDIILDMTTKGTVCGVEILNASEFFSQFDITKKDLVALSSAELNSTVKPSGIVINLTLKTKNKEIPAKIAVPTSFSSSAC